MSGNAVKMNEIGKSHIRLAVRLISSGLFISSALTLIFVANLTTFSQRTLPEEEHLYIDWERPGMKLFLRHMSPVKPVGSKKGRVVLITHGTAVPSSGNAAFAVGGRSWMSDFAENGFDVWALDFAGFGKSSRYPEMDAPANTNPPLGRAEECSRQIGLAIRYIMKRQRVKKVSLIGDSGGTLVAGLYATRKPEVIDRLVLYGPVGRKGNSDGARPSDAYSLFTPEPLVEQFAGSVPADEKPVFDKKYFRDVWSPLFLDNDPTSRERNPPSVKIPNGRIADAAEINAGKFPYDPSKIQAPTLVIIGEWDTVTPDEGARELFDSLKSARLKRYVIIGRATHTVQFEESRFQLYEEVRTFLAGGDSPHGQGTIKARKK